MSSDHSLRPRETRFHTASDTHKKVYNMIRNFYDFAPQKATKAQYHSDSDKTREPMPFDRHLHEDLTLKRIRYLPNLKQFLADIAQDALDSYPGNLPSPVLDDDNFPLPHRIATMKLKEFKDETNVQDAYQDLAKFFTTVAATLESQSSEWGQGSFSWTLNGSASTGYTRAKSDGYLTVTDTPLVAGDDTRKVYEVFRDIANWEFKSLEAGRLEIMEAIMEYSKDSIDFPWVKCALDESACSYSAHTRPTGARMGLDAVSPRPAPLGMDGRVWGTPSTQVLPKDRLHAGHILQQLWAQLVDNDATFGVINSHAYEILCYRSRKDQTLYISDLIVVQDRRVTAPGYGQLHVGLYIAAIRDAKNRACRLLSLAEMPRLWETPYANTLLSNKLNLKDRNSPLQKKKFRKTQKTPLTDEWITKESITRLALVFTQWKNEIKFATYHTDRVYFRCVGPKLIINTPSDVVKDMWHTVEDHEPQEPYMTLQITETVEVGVYVGERLTIDEYAYSDEYLKHHRFGSRLCVRTSTNAKEAQKLLSEYAIYREIRRYHKEKPRHTFALPRVLGIFAAGDTDLALVTEYARPLDATDSVSDMQKTAFHRALADIHNARILHGNLKATKLLFSDNKQVFIVGFKAWRPCPTMTDIEEEKRRLTDTLENPTPERNDLAFSWLGLHAQRAAEGRGDIGDSDFATSRFTSPSVTYETAIESSSAMIFDSTSVTVESTTQFQSTRKTNGFAKMGTSRAAPSSPKKKGSDGRTSITNSSSASGPAGTPPKKVRAAHCCKTCGRPMKGHDKDECVANK